jgi:hypothetical protein
MGLVVRLAIRVKHLVGGYFEFTQRGGGRESVLERRVVRIRPRRAIHIAIAVVITQEVSALGF